MELELELTRQSGANSTHVNVTCNGQPSHSFDLLTLVPDEEKGIPQPLEDPIAYGQAIYAALFPPSSPALHALEEMPDRILLVTTDDVLDAVPWEYAYGPHGFLVLEYRFVRGLPAAKRIAAPTLESGLHIVAIPSNPLDKDLHPLDIEGEWTRLREIIRGVRYDITLERTRPPTIEQVRRLVGGQHHRVVHFMGHGGRGETGALLCFEKENGALELIQAEEFIRRVRGTTFLVTLNACVSATPGPTHFSNLAASLIRANIPYVLGMRFSIVDDDALAFSKEFYSELARGIEVEEALLQARQTLARSDRRWAIGVPVLYTALATPANGFTCHTGTPTVDDHQPPVEATVLPAVVGAFQGRIDEQRQLGTALTSTSRPPILTIHGGGGQGKTSLAREAVQRFAHAWPNGVYAVTLENLPRREVFVSGLARFLGMTSQPVADPAELERAVLRHLSTNRTLIVLDNAETLYDAVVVNKDAEAIRLAQLLQQLPASSAGLLVTSRVTLGWGGEVSFEIGGLSPAEGAALFRQSAPQRQDAIEMAVAEQLSQKVDGHPFSLYLLAGAFNNQAISLPDFIQAWEAQLLQAENIFVGLEHRQRKLFTSIETSVRSLNEHLRTLLSKLWIFHAPFQADAAVAIFDPENSDNDASPIPNQLYTLWQRGLLVRETTALAEGTFELYRLLPTMRPYIEKYLKRDDESEGLLTRFGAAYAKLVSHLYRELNQDSVAAFLVSQLREDMERAASFITDIMQSNYLLDWGWMLVRLGEPQRGIKLFEQALEIAQEQNRHLEGKALNNIATVYSITGQPQKALIFYELALPIKREEGDRNGEAAALIGIANVYFSTGQLQKALTLYEQASLIDDVKGDLTDKAITLHSIANVYQSIGQPEKALELYEEALLALRKGNNRSAEATTLSSMAALYTKTGQSQKASTLYEQALAIAREIDDHSVEASTLAGLAHIYEKKGLIQKAQTFYEQALSIARLINNRVAEAVILNNMALMYQHMGRLEEALVLCEQALPIRREVKDRSGEATSLHNKAVIYQSMGKLPDSLALYELALSIRREVSDLAGEGTTLHNIGTVYANMGQKQKAINFYQQALPIRREVSDLEGEIDTLCMMALAYKETMPLQETLNLYEQALQLQRKIGNAVGEAASLVQMALLLYPVQTEQVILYWEESIAVLEKNDIPEEVINRHLIEDIKNLLKDMKARQNELTEEVTVVVIDSRVLDFIFYNTVKVFNTAPEMLSKWHAKLTDMRQQAIESGVDEMVTLLDAIIGLLNASGNAEGLGMNLTGVFAQVWQEIVKQVIITANE